MINKIQRICEIDPLARVKSSDIMKVGAFEKQTQLAAVTCLIVPKSKDDYKVKMVLGDRIYTADYGAQHGEISDQLAQVFTENIIYNGGSQNFPRLAAPLKKFNRNLHYRLCNFSAVRDLPYEISFRNFVALSHILTEFDRTNGSKTKDYYAQYGETQENHLDSVFGNAPTHIKLKRMAEMWLHDGKVM